MVQKSARMAQLEAMLADEPNDAFLRYGLAMEYASQGDDATAAAKLVELIAVEPYVPAFLMAGQALARLGRVSEAVAVLRQGVDAARAQRNDHALGEMQGLIDTLE